MQDPLSSTSTSCKNRQHQTPTCVFVTIFPRVHFNQHSILFFSSLSTGIAINPADIISVLVADFNGKSSCGTGGSPPSARYECMGANKKKQQPSFHSPFQLSSNGEFEIFHFTQHTKWTESGKFLAAWIYNQTMPNWLYPKFDLFAHQESSLRSKQCQLVRKLITERMGQPINGDCPNIGIA